MSAPLAMIVGLGNPGQQYRNNRHNAGALFLDRLCSKTGYSLKVDKKIFGETGTARIANIELRLLFPTTYMNESGRAVAALANYFKIKPQEILVVYDELDLPLGTARLKQGGGHGGHNGIRDIITALGTPDFLRLRLGIGHPGHASKVLKHVLSDFRSAENIEFGLMTDRCLNVLPQVIAGNIEAAMKQLHTKAGTQE
jgi:PTH1 family peptidyl-tRNA hydrolase